MTTQHVTRPSFGRRSLRLLIAVSAVAAIAPTRAPAQTRDDTSAIRAAALDYIEGWYEADAERMASALHPELVKRIHVTDPRTGRSVLRYQGKSQLVANTAAGGGSGVAKQDRLTDVTVLDIFRGAAVVRVDATDWVDYLQLVKQDGRWLIVQVLWELRRDPRPPGP